MIDLGKLKSDVHLTASIEKLNDLHGKALDCLKSLDAADQQSLLLIMERLVLGSRGHHATVKFGKNVWSATICAVCGAPLDAKGQAFWLISRWENASRMLCWCETCSKETFEVDIDILTGNVTSQIGQA
jgi:hypothetical protein